MSRLRSIILDAFPPFIGAVIALGLMALFSDATKTLPKIYDSTFPIIHFGYIDHTTLKWQPAIQRVFRSPERTCWSVYSEKIAAAHVLGYDFFADGGDTSANIPTAAYPVDENNQHFDDDDPRGKLKDHLPGEQFTRRYCFDVAGRIPDFRSITITGMGTHSRWPHWWFTKTPTPQFTICPLKGRGGSNCMNPST